MSKEILPGATIGIIGGGLVAYYLTLSAKQMGYKVAILSDDKECLAGTLADSHFNSHVNDISMLFNLMKVADVITNVSDDLKTEHLNYLSRESYIPQYAYADDISQNRVLKKEFLDNHSINIAPFMIASLVSDVRQAAEDIGYPCVVKTNKRYQSKNERTIVLTSPKDVDKAVPLVQKGLCIVESFIDVTSEWQLSIAVDTQGRYSLFPLVRIVPTEISGSHYVNAAKEWPNLDNEIVEQMTLIIQVIALELNVCGVLNVSFFLTEENNLYVNSITTHPNEYNLSTVKACDFSVYDLHIRSICGLSLPKVSVFSSALLIPILNIEMDSLNSLIVSKPYWQFDLSSYFHIEEQLGLVQIFPKNVKETIQEVKYSGLIKNVEDFQGRYD